MDTTASASAKVQHITKKSSDGLLRKFADDSGNDEAQKEQILRIAKRRTKSWTVREEDGQSESPSNCSTTLVERRLLLPAVATRRSALLRQLRIGRAQLGARDVRNKLLLATIEKVRFIHVLQKFLLLLLLIINVTE